MTKASDKARDIILARRKFFIASAMAGAALTSCDRKPDVCLDMPMETDDSARRTRPAKPQPQPSADPNVCLDMPLPEPSVCLEVPPPDPSASASASASAAAEPPRPAPRACFKALPPPPKVCLKQAAPDDEL